MHVQSDILLFADTFENFRSKCIEIYNLDPAHFLPARGLPWQACLKRTEIKLELLADINTLLMIEKRIKGGYNANNKYMKHYNKNKDLSYLMYLDANNLYGWEMSKKLPAYGFKWNMLKFNEGFIKTMVWH